VAAPGDLLEWDMRIRGRGRGPSRSVRARVRLVAHRPGSPAQLLWLLRHSPDEERHRPHPFASDRSSRGEPADRSLYALLDAVPDALLLLDAERRVLFGNRAAARLVGPATGRPLDDLLLAAVHPDDRARVRRSLLHGNRPAGHDGATRFRLCRDDGSWRDVAATIVRAPPGSGAHGALLSMRDVSDFTRAEQTAEAFRAYQAVAAALTAEAAGPADDRAIAERVARLAVPAIADSCVIYLLDADGTARPVAAHHHERRDSPAGARLPPVGVDAAPRAGLIARVIGDREPLLVPALTQHGSAQLAGDIALESGEPAIRPSSLLVLPLTADGSRATGALLLSYTRSGRRYGDEDLLLGRDLARQLALVLECARLARQVRRSGGDGSPVGGDAGSEAAQRWEPGGEDTGRQVSRREREVLDLLEQGLTNRQIAARLVLSERTVEHHISRMLARFRLATRTHLTAYALKQGLIGGRRPTSG
jgi:PAS domain S-box-containing protein